MIDSRQAVKTAEKGGFRQPKNKARKSHLLLDRLELIEDYQSKLRPDQIRMVLSAKWWPRKVAVTVLD